MKADRIRAALEEGRVAVGQVLMEFGTRGIAKIVALADLDYVVIDMEHSAFGIERVADLIAWFKATEVVPIVRVPQHLYHFVAGVLDAGAGGIMVGNVESADGARAIVRDAKYPPQGARGLGLTAAHSDFTTPRSGEFLAATNRETMIFAQIESAAGLASAAAIAAVDGIDVLTIGHNDLTLSMGIHGQFDHPQFTRALADVADACRANGKVAHMTALSPSKATEYVAMGYRILMLRPDAIVFRDALKALADDIRSAAAR